MKLFLSSKNFVYFILFLLLVGGPASTYYFYNQYQKVKKMLQNPTEAAKEESKALVDKVGKLIELPGGEEPTVATIIDASKLKNQPFFSKAKNGDKVLLYTNAKKAILYNPSENKIIDVAPINIGTQSASPESPVPTPTPTKIPAKTPASP